MTVRIVGGLVSVEDGVKSAIEYAPARKVRVDLSFDVAEGSDARVALEHTAILANAQVRALLHQAPDVSSVRAEAALAAADKASVEIENSADHPADAAIALAVAIHEEKKRTRRTKAEMEAARAVEITAVTETAPSAVSMADPSAIEDDRPQTGSSAQSTGADQTEVNAASSATADLSSIDGIDDITTAADPVITDADLNAAVQKRNGVIQSPTKIKELIALFRIGTGPFQLSMIAQAQRRDFLDRLEKLTA